MNEKNEGDTMAEQQQQAHKIRYEHAHRGPTVHADGAHVSMRSGSGVANIRFFAELPAMPMTSAQTGGQSIDENDCIVRDVVSSVAVPVFALSMLHAQLGQLVQHLQQQQEAAKAAADKAKAKAEAKAAKKSQRKK